MKTLETLILLALLGTTFNLFANELKLEECPAVVQETIRANARDGKIEEVNSIVIADRTLYVAEIDLPGGKDLKIYLGSDGKLVKAREAIALVDSPAEVQEAARRLVPEGGRIDDVDKEISEGKKTYHVEIDYPKAEDLDVVFAADGTVISQKEDPRD